MSLSRFCIPPVAFLCLLLAACGRQEIEVYTAPKEIDAAHPAAASTAEEHGHAHAAPPAQPPTPTPPPPSREPQPRPKLSWTLPPGWAPADAGQVNAAAFQIQSETGQASVNITPMPEMKGREAMVLNMWRQQVGSAPQEAAAPGMEVEVAGGKGELWEIEGSRDGQAALIVAAVRHEDGKSWFYKLAGDRTAVEQQKLPFLEFMKSVRIEAPAAAGAEAPAPAASQNP